MVTYASTRLEEKKCFMTVTTKNLVLHCTSARWKTRGRGPGVRGTGSRGVENTGCGKRGVWKTRGQGGKHGVWWKTRGLSGKHGVLMKKNTGKLFFRQNMNFPH